MYIAFASLLHQFNVHKRARYTYTLKILKYNTIHRYERVALYTKTKKPANQNYAC